MLLLTMLVLRYTVRLTATLLADHAVVEMQLLRYTGSATIRYLQGEIHLLRYIGSGRLGLPPAR
jgi:hypothetical protein